MRPLESVWIDYTNYKLERSIREIIPASIEFGNSEWHPDSQWLLVAYDIGKGAEREFALRDIHKWSSTKP